MYPLHIRLNRILHAEYFIRGSVFSKWNGKSYMLQVHRDSSEQLGWTSRADTQNGEVRLMHPGVRSIGCLIPLTERGGDGGTSRDVSVRGDTRRLHPFKFSILCNFYFIFPQSSNIFKNFNFPFHQFNPPIRIFASQLNFYYNF